MLRSCYNNIGVLCLVLLALVFCLQARPPLRRKAGSFLNDSEIIRIKFKRLPLQNGTSYSHNNRTKTRILFRDGNNGDFAEQDIIFPDSYEVHFEQLPRIDGIPNCAQGSTFCENIASYPHNQVQQVLRHSNIHNDLFGKDEAPEDTKISIVNRIGEEEEFVCQALERTIFPKVGKNKSNKWKFIINQGEHEGYIQGVRVETCRQRNAPCDIIGELPNGYITSCKQKYIYRRMMSLSENGEAVPDTFQLPSACCCSYRRDHQFLSRFGNPLTPAK